MGAVVGEHMDIRLMAVCALDANVRKSDVQIVRGDRANAARIAPFAIAEITKLGDLSLVCCVRQMGHYPGDSRGARKALRRSRIGGYVAGAATPRAPRMASENAPDF